MSRRKVAPWLLSASVFLGAGLFAMTPAQAITSVEELRDVDSSSWAYSALADLVEKYDVIEGYPDYTFKGNRTATRYEMAAALNALIKAVGRDLARLGAEKANKSDLATLARLQEEFRNELAALNARTSALESRASAIEAKNAEQDTRLDLLEKTQLHGDLSFGVLADVAGNGDGPGIADNGIRDGISALGRFRLGLKVPVVQGNDDSVVGEGDVIARIVGAFGRWTPQGANPGVNNIFSMSGYSALAGQSSIFNEGINSDSLSLNSGTTGLNLRQNLYLESAYYKQNYKSGIIPGVNLFGDDETHKASTDIYVGIVPWRNLFNRSPYRGDELNQFQNTALVNNAGMLGNHILPTVAVAYHQGLGEHASLDITGAAASMDISDAMDGFTVTEEVGLNYDWFCDKPGSLYVGGNHIMFMGNQTIAQSVGPGNFINRDGNNIQFINAGNQTVNSFYTGWNQEWWRGIGTSVDWAINNANSANVVVNSLTNGTGVNASINNNGPSVGVNWALSAVLSVPMTVFNQNLTKRAKDVWGFGYSLINPMKSSGEAQTFTAKDEHVFETFYRWAVNDSVTVIPSVQAIVNRFGVGENDATMVFGLRTNYVF